uniref:Reverse transcriptase Ty1/copia-type domain-containing protein n=1 Tax=Lactuca sativa TaxID=4236 RepID=A0A9R1XFD0_LACSA|nr:hypothetical protein LSAT_V11C500277740 [Lactuca sativa]
MTLPWGYHSKNDINVYKLVKYLYGLEHDPRKRFGFQQSVNDYSLFVRNKHNIVIIFLVYVDDIIFTGNNITEIGKVKDYLKTQFLIKDFGKLSYFLGMKVCLGVNLSRQVGWKLICLTITRPAISYYVQILSRFMHKTRKSYLQIPFRLLWYLKINPCKGTSLIKSDNVNLSVTLHFPFTYLLKEY